MYPIFIITILYHYYYRKIFSPELGIELKASHMLSTCSTTQLNLKPSFQESSGGTIHFFKKFNHVTDIKIQVQIITKLLVALKVNCSVMCIKYLYKKNMDAKVQI